MIILISGLILALFEERSANVYLGLIIVDVMLAAFMLMALFYKNIEKEEFGEDVDPAAKLTCWHCGKPTLARRKSCQHCQRELQ